MANGLADVPAVKLARKQDTGPRSVLRVMEIVRLLGEHPEGLSLAKLKENLRVPKTSLLSILRVLEKTHYIAGRGGVYILSSESLKLGAILSRSRRFPGCARSTLEQLCNELGETAILGTLSEEGGSILYLDVVESDQSLKFSVKPGEVRPAYSSAIGQAILAFKEDDFRKDYIRKTKFIAFTPETLNANTLPGYLATVRRTGIARNIDGRVGGVVGTACPIFDSSGAVHSAISVGVPKTRYEGQGPKIEQALMRACETISRILGYTGRYLPQVPEQSA